MKQVWRWRLLLLALLIVLAGSPDALAQTNTELVTGIVSLVHGDTAPENPTDSEHLTVALLKAEDGSSHQLELRQDQLVQLSDGAKVTLEVPRGTSGEDFVPVTSVVRNDKSKNIAPQVATQGNIPYVNLLCRFPGDPEPQNRDYYAKAVESMDPHTLLWFWSQMGVDISNSDSLFKWVDMPRPKSEYLVYDPESKRWYPKFDLIRNDCVDAARPYIGFERYKGINFIYSSEMGCCFWGSRNLAVTANDGVTRYYNYTMGDGSYGWWLAFIVHEMGHGLPADVGDRGLSHTHDQKGKMGNIFDPMSQPAKFCTDLTEWSCSGQGLTLPQLRRLGNSPATLVVNADFIGVQEADVNCLYGQLENGHVRGVEVYFQDGTRLSIEVRCGGHEDPDYKLGQLSGVVVLHVKEDYHNTPDGTFQDLLQCWDTTSACDKPEHTIAGRGKSMEFRDVKLEVTRQTNAGFHVKVERKGAMKVYAFVANFTAWVVANDSPAGAQLPDPLAALAVIDEKEGDGKPTQYFTFMLYRTPNTPANQAIWTGLIPCVHGTHSVTIRAQVLGIDTEDNEAIITCAGQVRLPIAIRQ